MFTPADPQIERTCPRSRQNLAGNCMLNGVGDWPVRIPFLIIFTTRLYYFMSMTRLVLASASPRRRALIQLLDVPYEVATADVDEDRITDPDPAVNVMRTAALKARTVAQRLTGDVVVIGADTTVAAAGRMLNKPRDSAEARAMLRALRGRVHQVHTGLALLHVGTDRMMTDVTTVDVPMRAYTDEEIEAYIETGDPLDKAGAYAIQHAGFRPVAQLHGCFAGVMGLGLCHLTRSLRALGIAVAANVPAACQAAIAYECPVFGEILSVPQTR